MKLNPVRLTKPALELIRSMVGREIRATVVNSNGGMLLLRSGGTLIEARGTGAPLKTGQQLFLKIEQPATGSYRLVVLDPGTSAISGGGLAAQLAQALPPGPLQQLFGAFLRHYALHRQPGGASGARSGESGRGVPAAPVSGNPGVGGGMAPGAHDGSKAGSVVQRMLDAMQGLAARVAELDQGALAQLMQSLARSDAGGQAPDFWLAQGWAGDSGAEAAEDDAADTAEESVAVLGRLAEPPYYFLSDFQFAATGRISVLLISADQDFRRISLYLHPERAATAAWLEAESGRLRRQIGDAVQWERLEIIGPRELRPEGGGGILNLQG